MFSSFVISAGIDMEAGMEMRLGGLGQLGTLGLPILGGKVLKKLSRVLPFHTTSKLEEQ